jgi:hypothetical protein
MKTKLIATIVIITILAGFMSLVTQISQEASATAIFCPKKGSQERGAAVCSEGDCKRIFTPSGKINTNSKC